MLIKSSDDQSTLIRDLEHRASGEGAAAKHAAHELRARKAGIRGEAESAYLIDFEFAASPNWAVIHDLRLEHRGRTAQIDHLLINRWLDIYVLESKHFHAGLKITDEGEFLQWNDYRKTFAGMASPLEQNERHIAVLRDAVGTIDWPQRLGLRIAPIFHSLILVAPKARIDRPKAFDTTRVIKADQLKKQIWKDIDAENPLFAMIKTAAKIVSPETVEFVARQLVTLHRPRTQGPTESAPARELHASPSDPRHAEPTLAARSTSAVTGEPSAPACKTCGKDAGGILHGKFGYYFKCDGCGGNTSIRFTCQPGHNPRLRKEGLAFYRECADCGSSALYHRNRS